MFDHFWRFYYGMKNVNIWVVYIVIFVHKPLRWTVCCFIRCRLLTRIKSELWNLSLTKFNHPLHNKKQTPQLLTVKDFCLVLRFFSEQWSGQELEKTQALWISLIASQPLSLIHILILSNSSWTESKISHWHTGMTHPAARRANSETSTPQLSVHWWKIQIKHDPTAIPRISIC